MDGQEQTASPETLQSVLEALGVHLEHDSKLSRAPAAQGRRQPSKSLEPVMVAWDGRPRRMTVRLPANKTQRHFQFRLVLEDGQEQQLRLSEHRESFSKRRGKQSEGEGEVVRELVLPGVP